MVNNIRKTISRLFLSGSAFAILTILLSGFAPVPSLAQQSLDIRKPDLDSQGRFWVYRDPGALIFLPYGHMPPEMADNKWISMDVACTINPYEERDSAKPDPAKQPSAEKKDEKKTCISLTCKWKSEGDKINPGWAAVAFIAGPDKPPFWGEDDRGIYFDLSTLPKKRFVCQVRGEKGTERLKLQIGILGSKKYGDSLPFPVETRWIKLTKEWQRVQIDLSKYSAKDLSRITNGLTLVLAQAQQEGHPDSTTVYVAHAYYE